MPYLQLHDQRFPLRAGPMRLGFGPDADIRVPAGGAEASDTGDADGSAVAVVRLGDAGATIAPARPGAAIRVNGVLLAEGATPLMHGDKIDIHGVELSFGDDRQGGTTQFIRTADLSEVRRARAGAPPPAPAAGAATGGRIVSLIDGRDYSVGPGGLTIGRDAECDVVLPSSDVSRRHAELRLGEAGYEILDLSTNGLFVNDERVAGARPLHRGDILRMGAEEFRFHADAPLVPPAPPPPPGAPAPVPAAAPPVIPRETLARMEVVSPGALYGRSYDVTAILVAVGRGAHNEIVLADDTVSHAHATLRRRDRVWYVTDVGSRNGTYANGRRTQGETRIGHVAELRLGGVTLAFAAAALEPITAPVAPGTAPARDASSGRLWLLALIVITGVTAYLLLRGR